VSRRKPRIDIGDGKVDYPYRKQAETAMKRRLGRDEHVHHMDGNPGNDDWGNIAVMPRDAHRGVHALRRAMRGGKITLFDKHGRPYHPRKGVIYE